MNQFDVQSNQQVSRSGATKPLMALASIDLFEMLLSVAKAEGLVDQNEAEQLSKAVSAQQKKHTAFSFIGELALLNLIDLLIQRWGGVEVGAILALKADLGKLGIMGELFAKAETPYAAYYQISRFSRLLNQRSKFNVDTTPYRLQITRQHPGVEPRFQRAAQMATIWSLAHIALVPRKFFQADVYPTCTRFDFAEVTDIALMRSIFGPSIAFDQDDASVTFLRADLKDIRRQDSFRMFETLESIAESSLIEIGPVNNLATQVERYLKHHMKYIVPDQEEVAKYLILSVRSLQRKLALEGTSFRKILDNVRQEEAERLLKLKQISISEIAFRLGYAEQAIFTRSVYRWYGHSPSEVRRRLTE